MFPDSLIVDCSIYYFYITALLILREDSQTKLEILKKLNIYSCDAYNIICVICPGDYLSDNKLYYSVIITHTYVTILAFPRLERIIV